MIINMLKFAAGMQTSVTNENGADFVSVSGYGTFPIKDQLSQLGFRWDGPNKRWRMMLRQLLANPSALSRLQTLGVDTSPLGGAANTPTAPKQPQNWLSRSGVVWYLAKRKEDGQPIVLNKGNGVWNWMLSSGEQGSFPEKDIATLVESVRTPDGKPVSGSDPMKLLASQTPVETAKQPEQGPKGRIPPDKISPEQKEIETSFLNSQSSIMTNALAGSGKAQPFDSLLLSPDGWIRMGDIKVGDKIFGSDGLAYDVQGIFPQGLKDVYEVKFSDGAKVKCCADHLWKTEAKPNRDLCRYHKQPLFSRAKIVSTSEIMNDMYYRDRPKHYIPLTLPVCFPHKEVKIDPYLMGVLLGDGCFRTGSVSYSSVDRELIESINNVLPPPLRSRPTGYGCDYRISGSIKGVRNPVVAEIKELGLWKLSSNTKFIPEIYKINDLATRVSVFQGLMDTDGHCSRTHLEYYTVSERLAEDVSFLVRSFGGTAKITIKETSYVYRDDRKQGKICFRVHIKLPSFIAPFRLGRKLNKYCPSAKYHARRAIVDIKKIGKEECQCISISSPDNLYITDDFVLTHNTTMLRHLSSFMKPGEKWLYLVFNKKNQVEGREKFPKGVEVLTSHAFLGRVLGRSAELGLTEQTEIWNQGERISQILDHSMDQDNTFPRPLKYAAKKIIKQLATLGKAYAIIPNASDASAQLQQIIQQYQIDCDLSTDKFRTEVDYTQQLIDKALDLMHSCLPGKIGVPQFQNFRDHDDTLWYAAIMNEQIKWPKYDVVLADEVQDFNRCQVIMLQKLAQAGARIIAVGDPNQAIYLFRGADANAFNNIGGMMEGLPSGAASHTLPTNYRSGKAIINFVNENTKVKNLRAGMQHEGLVTANTMYDDAIGNLSTEWRQSKKFSQPTAFISRTNKPLVTAALDLMRNDMDFVLIGRDFSQELVSHLKKVLGEGRNQRSVPITGLAEELLGYAGSVEERWAGKISKAPELKQIKETTESLVEVIGYLQSNNFRDPRVNMQVRDSAMFIEYLRSRFGGVNTDTAEGAAQLSKRDPRSYVTICTAHRSKGLEFDRVFILKNELFPHPNAKTPEALDQEENAKYVAYTRAMNELHILIHPVEPQPQENQRR